MVKCAIKTCGLRKDNYNHGLTLHRLPRNELEKKRWIDVIGADNINLNIKNNFICSIHFEESSFNRTLDVIRLRDNSVPSLYLQSPAPMQEFLLPVLPVPANKMRQAGTQRSCEQIKVTSGPSPKYDGKYISYPLAEIKSKDQLSDADPLADHPVPLSDAPDPLGEAIMTRAIQQARLKEDTYQISMQTNKLNALNTRCRALNKKLKRYRELLRRRDKKMADLQADVDSLRNIITEHDRAAGGDAGDAGEPDAPQIQVLSSKDGVVKNKSNRQVLYIKRGVTRLKSPAQGLHKSLTSVIRRTDNRPKSPASVICTSVIRQKAPAGVIRTSVIRKTSPEIRQKSPLMRQKSPEIRQKSSEIRHKSSEITINSSDILQKSLMGVMPTLDLRQKFPVDVQRTSDIPPNALVIQIDGKHSAVLQPTLVRREHFAHMETG